MSNTVEFVDPYDPSYNQYWIKIEHLARYYFAHATLSTTPPPSLLDLWFGNGYGTSILSSLWSDITWIDYNKKNVDYASAHNASTFLHEDIDKLTSLPSVDAAVSFETIEHLEDPLHTLDMIYRSLTPWWTFICSVPNKQFERQNSDGKPSNEFHKHLFWRDQFATMLSDQWFLKIERRWQTFSNQLIARERDARKRKKLSTSTHDTLFHSPEMLDYGAQVYAYPSQIDLEKSYSMIFVCKKPG